jgi:hypothetical protein
MTNLDTVAHDVAPLFPLTPDADVAVANPTDDGEEMTEYGRQLAADAEAFRAEVAEQNDPAPVVEDVTPAPATSAAAPTGKDSPAENVAAPPAPVMQDDPNKVRMTVVQLAERLGVSDAAARGLTTFLLDPKVALISKNGTVKKGPAADGKGSRGRSPDALLIPRDLGAQVADLFDSMLA